MSTRNARAALGVSRRLTQSPDMTPGVKCGQKINKCGHVDCGLWTQGRFQNIGFDRHGQFP